VGILTDEKRKHSQALGIQYIEDGRSDRFAIVMNVAIYAHNDGWRALARPFVISHSVTPKADDMMIPLGMTMPIKDTVCDGLP
jgi:hypothetical protein